MCTSMILSGPGARGARRQHELALAHAYSVCVAHEPRRARPADEGHDRR